MRIADELATANHILYDQGILDGFGHVSQRDDLHPERFHLGAQHGASLVTPTDILAFDLAGEAVVSDGQKVYLERFIHAAIYQARPDVTAIVHSHAPSILPSPCRWRSALPDLPHERLHPPRHAGL